MSSVTSSKAIPPEFYLYNPTTGKIDLGITPAEALRYSSIKENEEPELLQCESCQHQFVVEEQDIFSGHKNITLTFGPGLKTFRDIVSLGHIGFKTDSNSALIVKCRNFIAHTAGGDSLVKLATSGLHIRIKSVATFKDHLKQIISPTPASSEDLSSLDATTETWLEHQRTVREAGVRSVVIPNVDVNHFDQILEDTQLYTCSVRG